MCVKKVKFWYLLYLENCFIIELFKKKSFIRSIFVIDILKIYCMLYKINELKLNFLNNSSFVYYCYF